MKNYKLPDFEKYKHLSKIKAIQIEYNVSLNMIKNCLEQLISKHIQDLNNTNKLIKDIEYYSNMAEFYFKSYKKEINA